MPRRLGPDDVLYRVIDPDHRDQYGPMAVAFEDPGKPYESLSFFVARIATPAQALSALARFKRAKDVCGTRNRQPTPTEMADHGYVVGAISATIILEAIRRTELSKRPLSIAKVGDDDFEKNGHLNLHNGKYYAQTLAKRAILLTRQEILGSG